MKKMRIVVTFVLVALLFVSCPQATGSKSGSSSGSGGSGGTNTTGPIAVDMVKVTGGTFEMGPYISYIENSPAHDVTLNDFYMGVTEVTQGQWDAVMDYRPGYPEVSSQLVFNVNTNDNKAICVYWYDAIEFCNALSERNGYDAVYTIDKDTVDTNNSSTDDTRKWTVTADFTKNGYRLPTEAEWEYAAGGGNDTRTTYAGTDNGETTGDKPLSDYAWYAVNSNDSVQLVKQKSSNVLGLYDMSGNVSEWCWDWKGDYTSEDVTNPTGATSGDCRIHRGSSFTTTEDWKYMMEVKERLVAYPYSIHFQTIGLRVVRKAD